MGNSAQENGFIRMESNQLTTRELFNYMKLAYGKQINGSPFTYNLITMWMRVGAVPTAYGGYKVVNIEKYQNFNMSVLTLEGFDRSILDDIHLVAKPQVDIPAVSRPRKQRTKLYYEILKKNRKLFTRKTLEASTLPNNWRELGIKPNQLAGVHRKKKSKQLTVNTKS